MVLRHSLEPDRLPDATGWRVTESLAVLRHALLTQGLTVLLRAVPHADRQPVRSADQRIGDVERKGIIATPVLADFVPIQVNRGLPVAGLEVEMDAFAPHVGGQGEGALIPDALFGPQDMPDSRQRRINGKRNQ